MMKGRLMLYGINKERKLIPSWTPLNCAHPGKIRSKKIPSAQVRFPMLSLSQISQFKRENPDYNQTVIRVYDSNDKLVRIIKFNSRAAANEYLRESKEEFLVVDYGCN